MEARLIEAEAALQGGARPTFFAIHNTLRVGADLPPFVDSGQSVAELVDLHFSERAFWLYSTAHRLGDLRRLIRQHGRTQNQVFPTGQYHKNGTYGTDVNLPLGVDELNNPNVSSGCLNREA